MNWCVVYKALDDALSMELVEVFLELWLRMTFLELWLGMEGKHVAIPSCGLVILVTGVSMRVVGRMDSHHMKRQSWVMANDDINVMSRIRIMVCIGNST